MKESLEAVIPPEILALKELLNSHQSLHDALKTVKAATPHFKLKDWLGGTGAYNEPMQGDIVLGTQIKSAIHNAQTNLAEAFWLKGDNDTAMNIMTQTAALFAGENLDNPHIIPRVLK